MTSASEGPARLDVALVRRGLARSRGQARDLIQAGAVTVDGIPATKPAQPVPEDSDLAVTATAAHWVSRAAGKLDAGLRVWGPQGLRVTGRRALDAGASTGGFTQVLLEAGATQVVALDVGTAQLAGSIAADPRVVDRSGTSIRGADPADIGAPFDIVVADLSFISLTLVLPDLAAMTTPASDLVLLVKPQFEVGRARLGKNGIVTDPADHVRVLRDVLAAAAANALTIRGLIRSPIVGTTGNVEYLLWATREQWTKMDPEVWTTTVEALTGRTPP